jgi:integrase
LAIHTGLRQGELLELKRSDIDLDRGTLQVQRILSAAKNGPTFTTPKNNKGRSVRLTAQAVQALRDHRKRQVEERLKYDGFWQDHGLVFPTRVGTPVSRHNLVARSFKPLLKRAGLPDIRFHDLRHTCATLMLAVERSTLTLRWSKKHSDTPTSPSPWTSTRTCCPTCKTK